MQDVLASQPVVVNLRHVASHTTMACLPWHAERDAVCVSSQHVFHIV